MGTEGKTATMSRSQIEARMKAVEEELERLRQADQESGALDDTDDEYFDTLCREHDDLTRAWKQKKREERFEQIQSAVANPRARVQGAYPNEHEALPEQRDSVSLRKFRNPWDLSEVRTGLTPQQQVAEIRSRALCAAERLPFVDDKRKDVVTNLLERHDTRDGRLARQVLLSSSEEYVRAFAAVIGANGDMGRIDDEDRRLLARAMSLTDAAGGYLVPFQLDPAVVNTADGSFNQVRQVARKVIATGDTWHGVSSAGVTGAWTAEGGAATDGAPSLAQPSIPVHKLTIFVPISIEAAQDAANVANEVAQMIAFEKDVKESTAFVSGSGSGQPTGIVTALAGTGSEIAKTTTASLAESHVYELDNTLPLRYNFRATWLANKHTYNQIKQFNTTAPAMWGTAETGTPNALLSHLTAFGEAMGTADGLTAGQSAQPLILGDFNNYVVADRIGTTIEFVPHLFAGPATAGNIAMPTGQRGWYAYSRVGADSVNDAAFRMLKLSA